MVLKFRHLHPETLRHFPTACVINLMVADLNCLYICTEIFVLTSTFIWGTPRWEYVPLLRVSYDVSVSSPYDVRWQWFARVSCTKLAPYSVVLSSRENRHGGSRVAQFCLYFLLFCTYARWGHILISILVPIVAGRCIKTPHGGC